MYQGLLICSIRSSHVNIAKLGNLNIKVMDSVAKMGAYDDAIHFRQYVRLYNNLFAFSYIGNTEHK